MVWVGCKERNPAYIVLSKPADASGNINVTPPTIDTANGEVAVEVVADAGADTEIATSDVAMESASEVLVEKKDAAKDSLKDALNAPTNDSQDAAIKDLAEDYTDVGSGMDLQPTYACDKRESCNGIDDDCDGFVDEDLPTMLTCGLGIQEQSVPFCTAGRLNRCKSGSPGVNVDDGCPADGKDNDSDGIADEDCASDCVWVWSIPNMGWGEDTDTGNGSKQAPYNNLKKAIADAADNDIGKRRVCMLAGTNFYNNTNCLEVTFSVTGDLEIPDGVSIYGNYKDTDGIACTSQMTKIQLATHHGVVFGGKGTEGAALARVTLLRQPAFLSPTATTAAVTISGARRVTLSRLIVNDAPANGRTIGVHVTNAEANVIISRSHIQGGLGLTAIGTLIEAGTVALRSNCDTIDPFGNCTSPCNSTSLEYGIFGRQADNPMGWTSITSFGILVDKSASTTIEANSICGVVPNQPQPNTTAVALRCNSGSCAHIGKNHINGGTAKLVTGLSLIDTSTAVDSNQISGGCGITRTDAVVLDQTSVRLQNNLILGAQCASSQEGLVEGLVVIAGDRGTGPDVHSNTIEVGAVTGKCKGYGVVLMRSGVGPEMASGLFRNNIFGAGECTTNMALFSQASVLPVALHNNLFHPGSASETILFKYNQEVYKTIESINSKNSFAQSNLVGHPSYEVYPTNLKLRSNSPGIDAGTDQGAPLFDVNLVSRAKGTGFDIGAHEF
jgi:hypothetical protein